MPALCWFQKLRRRKKKSKQSPCRNQVAVSAVCADNCPSSQCPSLPAACALSPNRTSYYFPSADRERHDTGLRCVARRDDAGADATALDVRVDVVHRRAGEQRLGGLDVPPGTPELKLRPIVTRHVVAKNNASDNGGVSSANATTSAATTPSTRARGFHVKPSSGRRRRRRSDSNYAKKEEKAAAPLQHGGTRRRRWWLYESLVVVKASSDPERELAESMSEMVVANGIRSSEDLEELLACYLALNAAEHHRAVVAAFRRVWFHLARQRLHLITH
ncbi:transcription repressor OFP1-like [Phragmites australis]|uniref:transcription repressor OFP1-like n=1 Tax=Phragmites australis TaxID=29695 RepID=UPI002D785D20|nr:transcription repressor OFP1-like [Phragmites australis]